MKPFAKISNLYIFFTILLLMNNACTRPAEYPIEPKIEFVKLSKNTMRQSQFNIDSTWATISFTDGDGDLGESQVANVFIKDTRDNFDLPSFSLPFVPLQGANNGISGEINLLLYTSCCYYPDDTPPCDVSPLYPTDTLVYEIYIKDRAGHPSNIIKTDPIILQCN